VYQLREVLADHFLSPEHLLCGAVDVDDPVFVVQDEDSVVDLLDHEVPREGDHVPEPGAKEAEYPVDGHCPCDLYAGRDQDESAAQQQLDVGHEQEVRERADLQHRGNRDQDNGDVHHEEGGPERPVDVPGVAHVLEQPPAVHDPQPVRDDREEPERQPPIVGQDRPGLAGKHPGRRRLERRSSDEESVVPVRHCEHEHDRRIRKQGHPAGPGQPLAPTGEVDREKHRAHAQQWNRRQEQEEPAEFGLEGRSRDDSQRGPRPQQ